MEDMTTATFVESETQRMLVHVALRSKHELLRAQSHLQTLEEEVLATQEVCACMYNRWCSPRAPPPSSLLCGLIRSFARTLL